MIQVSYDIFYLVKKQILDKLDIILQKINLSILPYLPHIEDSHEYSFIELSNFEGQIEKLFEYLDKLYNSLNSSASDCSSINTNHYRSDHNIQLLTLQNSKLQEENSKLKKEIQHISSISEDYQKSIKQFCFKQDLFSYQNSIASIKQKMSNLSAECKSIAKEYQEFQKIIKKCFKKYRFDMLQNRVEIMSKMKEICNQRNLDPKKIKSESNYEEHECGEPNWKDKIDILQAINNILEIC